MDVITDHILNDKTITGVKIADDQMALLFETTDGDVVALADADCCSHTWVEHIELPPMGLPCTVVGVREIELPDAFTFADDDCVIEQYGCEILTEKGALNIEYRNESNGYYGGHLEWPDADGKHESFYGGVYGQNESTMNWVKVKE